MAYRGSVIPLFINQIKTNKDITITDPEMTRFLMSLDDSVDLVTYAFLNANQGDIFVQKSPASTIFDLAEALKKIFSSNVKTKIIGTRHGEKLYESLLSREEKSKAIDLDRYYQVPMDSRGLNYDNFFLDGKPEIILSDDYTSHNTDRLNIDEVIKLVSKLDIVKEALND